MILIRNNLLANALRFVAIAMMTFSGIALAEFGICPAYEQRFGPDDPVQNIEAFLTEINFKPGGGTVVLLESGSYKIAVPPISGTVCIRTVAGEEEWQRGFTGLDDIVVMPGGVLTIGSVPGRTNVVPAESVTVEPGATLFAEDVAMFALENRGTAYVSNSIARQTRNDGTLVWRGGRPGDPRLFGPDEGPSLINRGWALIDQTEIPSGMFCEDTECTAPGAEGRYPAIENRGFLFLLRSIVMPGCDSDGGTRTCNEEDLIVSKAGSTLFVSSSTILGETSILNEAGAVEIGQSIVNGDCRDVPAIDTGYNVFNKASCSITQPSSVRADPLLQPGWPAIDRDSPAVDRVPLDFCKTTDMLGRDRRDGNGDDIVACDAGALELYGRDERTIVEIRMPPVFEFKGIVDLRIDNALRMVVVSHGTFDPTSIDFSTIDIKGLDERALRGPVYADRDGDGREDYIFRYRLDRMPGLDCGRYIQPFFAETKDGVSLTGHASYEVIGCTP